MSTIDSSTTDDPRKVDSRSPITVTGWPTKRSIEESEPDYFGTVFVGLNRLSDRVDLLAQQICDRPEVWNGQMRDLGRDDLALSEPIMIVFERYPDEDTVSARFDEVGAYGEGATELEAIQALQREICALYQELTETASEKLGPLLAAWYRILGKLIVEE